MQWTKVKFTSNLVYADELIKEQYDDASVFFLFTSDMKTKQKSVFKISLDFMTASQEEESSASSSNEVKCDDKCISKSNNKHEICLNDELICDGFYDCQDNQDERDCSYSKDEKQPVEKSIDAQVAFNELKIKKDKFRLNFSISFSDQMKNYEINNCLIKIVTLKNRKLLDDAQESLIIKDTTEFFKKVDSQINLNYISFDNNKNGDKLLTVTEIQTDKLQNLLEVGSLDEQDEYLLLFYVDLTFDAQNVNNIYLLKESIVIRNQKSFSEMNHSYLINESRINLILFVLAVLGCLTFVVLIIYLLVAIKRRSETANKYAVLNDDKINPDILDEASTRKNVYSPVIKFKNIYKPIRKEDKLSLIKEVV